MGRMLGLLIYLVVTVALGLLLGFLMVVFRSTKVRGEGSPFPIIAAMLLLAVLGPFVYVEGLSRIYGSQMDGAVKRAFEESPLNGKIQYYRLTSYGSDKARALVVVEERASWGGTDRPVMSVALEKKGAGWKPSSYKVIYSDRLNK